MCQGKCCNCQAANRRKQSSSNMLRSLTSRRLTAASLCFALVFLSPVSYGDSNNESGRLNSAPRTNLLTTDGEAAEDGDLIQRWYKYDGNPVLRASELGTVFDVSVLQENGKFVMYFSWRPKQSIGRVESTDGIFWSAPVIVLGPNKKTGWEERVNRPVVLKRAETYYMWYTGQTKERSSIGYAISQDGITWKRASPKPVLVSDSTWEKVAVVAPHVIWDEGAGIFRMWYSGGEQYEPDAIGYATSTDGQTWAKLPSNPIFRSTPTNQWEQAKVTAAQVLQHANWYYMFYIGFGDEDHAQIGLARSKNGITEWQRHPQNPIIRRGGQGQWDSDSCYKPFAIFVDSQRWFLWYNGRKETTEQIGLAILEGENLFAPAF